MEGKLAGRGGFVSRITVRCRGVDEYESQSAAQGLRAKRIDVMLGKPLLFPAPWPSVLLRALRGEPPQPRSRFASAMTARA